MKPLLFLSLLILQIGCKSVCPTCHKTLPVFNGVDPSIPPVDNAINSANISIDPSSMVEAKGDKLVLKARVNCKKEGGNNDARDVKIIVLLPAEVSILSFKGPNGCLVWGKPDGSTDTRIKTGNLTFNQIHLARGESIDLEVITSKPSNPQAVNKENFAVFAYSSSADLILCDNYWCWKDPVAGCYSKK